MWFQRPHNLWRWRVTSHLFTACLLIGVTWLRPTQAAAEWQVRPKNRWHQIAQRLEQQFLSRPQQGYALRRLLRHYRRKGGYKALLKRLSQHSGKKRPQARTLRLALALVALQARDTQRAIPWLTSLLSPTLRAYLKGDANPFASASNTDNKRQTKPPPRQTKPSPRQTKQTKPSSSDTSTGQQDASGLQIQQLSSQQLRILNYWADAQFASQQWALARQAYELLLQVKSSRRRKLALRRKLLLLDEKEGRWDQVQKHYQALIRLQPRDASLRRSRARVLLRLGQKSQALQLLQSTLKLVSRRQRLQILLQIARIHLLMGQYPAALSEIQKIRRQLAPSHWMHRICLVMEMKVHRKQKTLPQLLQTYKKRARRQPARYLPLIPKIEQELERYPDALQSYQVLLRRSPKHPALSDMIKLLHRMQRYKQAQALLEKRMKLESQDTSWALSLVVTLHLSKQTQLRDQWLKKLVQKHAQERSFLYLLLEKIEDWKLPAAQRLMLYQRLCPLSPRSVNCYERWGVLLWEQGNKNRALTVWEAILQIRPTQPGHWLTLARIYRKHNYLFQSQRLLEKLRQRYPQYRRAQEELAQIYLRRRRPEQAIPLLRTALHRARKYSRRRQLRDALLRAMLQKDHHTVVQPVLLRNYILSPMKQEPRKLLLAYYLRHTYRYRRYSRYYGRRRLLYRRWFGGRHRPHYIVRYRPLRISIPSNIQLALHEGLQIFPKDVELHQMAVKVYHHQPVVLYHLYQLMLLHPTDTQRYIAQFRQRSHQLGRMKLLLPLLQRLTRRYPNRSSLWGALGREALHRRKVELSQKAYLRALRLDIKPFSYHCGLAQTYAQQKRWDKALQTLLTPGLKETKKQRAIRHRRWVHYGLLAGISQPRLYQMFHKRLNASPDVMLDVLYNLYQHILPTAPDRERQFFKYMLKQSTPVWSTYLDRPASTKVQRLRALTLLYVLDAPAFLQRLPDLTQDPAPSIRTMAALAIALHNQRDRFALLDRLERTDSHRMVRYAASFASTVLLDRVRSYSIAHVLKPELWQTWLLPLLRQRATSDRKVLPTIARVFPTLPLYLKRHIFATMERMTPKILEPLNHMLTYTPQRCFAYAVLDHLKQSDSNQAMKEAVDSLVVPKQFFRHHCSLKHLTPPHSPLSVHACHQKP